MCSDLLLRLEEHQQGLDPRAYTFGRRPVILAWCEEFSTHDDPFRAERQIKGWTELSALIEDLDELLGCQEEWENEAGKPRAGFWIAALSRRLRPGPAHKHGERLRTLPMNERLRRTEPLDFARGRLRRSAPPATM
jgi:hypothetical protein